MRDASTNGVSTVMPSPHRMHWMLVFAISCAASAGNASADGYLPTIGGRGGGQFQARCAPGELLTGFELRVGDDVDAIRPVCVVAYGPREIGTPRLTTGTGLIQRYANANREVLGIFNQSAGDWLELESGWYGGMGGGITRILCPGDRPIVTGMFVGAEGVDTVIVNNIHLFCGLAAAPSQTGDLPAAVFDAPAYTPSKAMFGIGGGGSQPYRDENTQHCPANQVAVGLHGRSGRWLDAIGLICGEPSTAVRSIGRVSTSGKSGPPRSICDAARDARARNSPAAPNLEAQCRASRPPVKSIGRVKTDTPTTPGPPRHICDAARDARARNSPAAPNLEAQCRAAGGPPVVSPPAAPPAADEPPAEPDPVPEPDA